MTSMDNIKALGDIRFAIRLQTICAMIRDIGAVPEGYDTALKGAQSELETLKARAFAELNDRYEIRERSE